MTYEAIGEAEAEDYYKLCDLETTEISAKEELAALYFAESKKWI